MIIHKYFFSKLMTVIQENVVTCTNFQRKQNKKLIQCYPLPQEMK